MRNHPGWIALALVLIASIRIAATYTVFNHTSDEQIHLACGMEWLDHGVYRWEAQHPPLSRVAAAVGPYLIGQRSANLPKKSAISLTLEGNAILYQNHRYELTLALARLGILPFFWIACLLVYRWGKRFNPGTAVVSVFLFSFLPPVLAHSAVATTDMALSAFLGASFLCGLVWLENPTLRNGLWFGGSVGLMVLSKFSGLVFFPASAGIGLAWYLWRTRTKPAMMWGMARGRAATFAVALLAGALLIWAGYRFSFGKVDFAGLRLPAPELYRGIQEVREHNSLGHRSYLLGQLSGEGFWLFYPVALGVKTPIAFLILMAAGTALAFRKRALRQAWLPVAFAGGILLVAAFSRINIGIRHVLPVYLAFSVLAALAVVSAWEQQNKVLRAAVGLLLVWFASSSALSHPDYLAYFNEFGGKEPERILVDSDLDWGQDVKRLSTRLRELGVTELTFAHMAILESEKEHGLPKLNRFMDVRYPNPGWSAVSLNLLKQRRFALGDRNWDIIPWPERYQPVERVGKSILLYYIPAASIPSH